VRASGPPVRPGTGGGTSARGGRPVRRGPTEGGGRSFKERRTTEGERPAATGRGAGGDRATHGAPVGEGEAPTRPVRPATRYEVKGEGKGLDGTARELAAATASKAARTRRRRPVPADVVTELRAAGTPREVARLELRLADASRAYERDRYTEALSILRELARAVPGVVAVRELYGLTLYRLGRWKEAIRELRAFAELSGSVDQHPVIADSERALGRHDRVAELWAELRSAGAGSDVLAEGRLVMAGSLADRGRIADAIELLAPAATREVRKPLERHVRQWYALADLYERSGDVPRARELFRKVVAADPELSDAPERLAALR